MLFAFFPELNSIEIITEIAIIFAVLLYFIGPKIIETELSHNKKNEEYSKKTIKIGELGEENVFFFGYGFPNFVNRSEDSIANFKKTESVSYLKINLEDIQNDTEKLNFVYRILYKKFNMLLLSKDLKLVEYDIISTSEPKVNTSLIAVFEVKTQNSLEFDSSKNAKELQYELKNKHGIPSTIISGAELYWFYTKYESLLKYLSIQRKTNPNKLFFSH